MGHKDESEKVSKSRSALLEDLNKVTRELEAMQADKKRTVKAYNEDLTAFRAQIKDILKDIDELKG